MKFALVAALCGFAFAAYSHQSIEAKWFGPEKEFLYNWDSQLASGLPVDSTQHATQRIISKVALQLSSRSSAWLQLRGFAVYASQDTLRTPSRLAPVETFDPVPMSGEQKEALSLPVRFRYESGIVSGLEFDKQDPTWSRNIKRAALNMLQINLFSSNAVNEQNEFRETTENHYSVNETTLEGDCTVLYSKVADAKEWKESRSEEDEMMFSKSIEFSRCLRRPNVLYAMPLSDECKECEPHMSKHGREMPALQQNTVMRFRVAGGSVDRFIIREVELSSKYVFAPIADEKPFINNEVVAKLTLEKSGEIREKMPKIDSDRKECLMHSTRTGKAREQWEMNGDEESLEEIKRTGDYEEVEAAKKTINDIRELVEENVEVETSHMFARLISILRRATVKQITEIHRYCNEVDQKLSTIFIDAVAEAGTKHCVDYIVKLTIDGHVTPIRAAYLMKALASMRLPSQKIINALNNLAKESVCKENPVLEQSVRLTVGVLINGLCVNPKSRWAHSREEVCPENVKEKMSDDLRRLYGAAKSRYDKVLALKTIANSGLELIHPVLEKIIFDREEEPTVRMQAMDALRLLRLTMSRRIQKTLMPVYKSRSEPTEVRITALFHLLHTQPDHGTLQQIADQINNERNGHVAAYSYTMLKSFASSESPCQKHYAERCQIALRLVKDEAKTRCEKYNSFNLQASINSEMLLSAGSIELSSVFSNDSILPKELMASIDALFAGHWNKNFLQIGATQQGLDRILRETLPKVESVHSIDDVVTRGRRSLFDQPKQMLQGLIDKLSIVTRRRSDEAERDPHAVVYIRYRNMDYALIPIEEEYFRQWKSVVSDGKINLREIEKILAEGADLKLKTAAMVYEITRIIPTTFGMPISVNCKMPLVASIKLETSVDLLPKGEPSLKGVEMKVKGEPSVTITHLCHTMVLSPLAHTGIKLQNSILASLPIDASIRAEYKNKKILMTTSFKVPREEKILFKALTRPVTFVRKVALETRKYAEPIEKTIYVPRYEGLNKEYDMVYGEEILGLGFHVQGNLYNPFGHNKFLPIVANEKHMEIRAVPAKEPVSEYRVNSETELFVESSLPEWRVFNDFFTKDNRQHFAVEKDSEEEWDETERESGFKKNVEKESGLKGIGHRTKVDVEAFGGSKKRYANFEVKAACEKESLSKCHVSLNAHRTPLLKEERENCRAEANLYTMFPEEVSSLKELKEQKHREFNAILKGSFGCKKTNVINIKVQAEQNKEMKKWISFVDKAEVSEIDSFKLLKEAGYLNQYKLEAEYKLDEKYETAVAQGYRLLNAWNWWNSRMEAKRNPSGKISAIVEIEPETRRYVNVTVNTPETQVVMESMSVPVKIPLLNIFHPVEMRSYKSHEYSRSVCEVRSNKINTFDDVIYKTPLTTCYSIVAKDCSVEPTFAVLVKKMKKSGEEKKIKVVTEQNVIEMWLEKGEMQFRVNGKTVREDSISRYDIVQLADRVYKIELEQLSVRFDGRVVRVELSQSMKGRQCGLCGHYDDDHEDEFRRADNVHTDDIEEFHRSFFARDDKDCEIEEEKVKSKKNYGRIEESSEEASAFEEIEYGKAIADDEDIPVERQQVLEYARRTCFSRTAVKECPRGEPSRFERVTLRFVCLPRDSKEARRFVREIRRGFVPLDSYKDAFTQQMKTAIECRP